MKNNILYVLKKTWKYERAILGTLGLQILVGVSVPWISMYLPVVILDGISGQITRDMLWFGIAGFIVLLTVCHIVHAYVNASYDTHLMNNKIHYLADLFRKNMELDYAYIENKEGQNQFQYVLHTLMNDAQGITGMLTRLGQLGSSVLSTILYTGMIAALDAGVVTILILTSVIHLLFVNYFLKRQHDQKEGWVDIERKTNYLFSYVQNGKSHKDIKLYAMQDWLSDKLHAFIQERIRWTQQLTQYNVYIGISDTILLILRDALAYYCIFQGLFTHQLDISEFTFYFSAITGFSAFISRLSMNIAYISQRNREVDAFREYMELPVMKGKKMLPKDHIPQLELQHVSFRYQEEGTEILKDINLVLKPGEKIALVGENGAGKSTLVKLLCGLYRPTSGKILMDGRELAPEELQTYFAVAFQDIHILPMTAAENIAFDRRPQSEKEVQSCIQKVGLEEIFPDINTPVTKLLYKEGKVLSGGQEQRLILARTLYRLLYQGASLLLLDEPTAALDPLAEQAFYRQYEQMTEGRSAVFISHRLASTQFCDRVLVLKEGRIIEEGTHQELLAKKGYYEEMFAIQSQYYRGDTV